MLEALKELHAYTVGKCTDPLHNEYCLYGAMGVTLHEDWQDQDTFLTWAQEYWTEACTGHPHLMITGPELIFGPATAELFGTSEEPPSYTAPTTPEEEDFQTQYVSKEEYARRAELCTDCEHLKGTRCTKFCTCSGDLHGSRRTDVKCPVGSW